MSSLQTTSSKYRNVKYLALLFVIPIIRYAMSVAYRARDANSDDGTFARGTERNENVKRSARERVARVYGYLKQFFCRQPKPAPEPDAPPPSITPNATSSTGSALSHNVESFNRSNVTVIGGNLICNSITTIYLTPNSPHAPHSSPIPQRPRNTL